MKYRRGDVVLVPFPFTDLTTTKARPAIVVSGSRYHATEPDMILAAVTSRIPVAAGPFDYVLADWQTAGLRFPSALKPVLFTLEPNLVLHCIGSLTAMDLGEICDTLRRALEL